MAYNPYSYKHNYSMRRHKAYMLEQELKKLREETGDPDLVRCPLCEKYINKSKTSLLGVCEVCKKN